jgi:hypothetical protein
VRCSQLLGACGVSLCCAVLAWGSSEFQVPGSSPQPASTALPAALRAHLGDERFDIVTSIRGLPLTVRGELQNLFGSGTLDIADPGADFQGTGPANPQLPTRRLVAAGCSRDFHCLVYYERAGSPLTWRTMLFQWTPAATRFEWGGTAPGGLATAEDVRKAVLSGAIRPTAGDW